jgi:hypothetical protein
LKFSPKTTGAGAAYGLFELGYITGADCWTPLRSWGFFPVWSLFLSSLPSPLLIVHTEENTPWAQRAGVRAPQEHYFFDQIPAVWDASFGSDWQYWWSIEVKRSINEAWFTWGLLLPQRNCLPSPVPYLATIRNRWYYRKSTHWTSENFPKRSLTYRTAWPGTHRILLKQKWVPEWSWSGANTRQQFKFLEGNF